jgi:hypothetical protein
MSEQDENKNPENPAEITESELERVSGGGHQTQLPDDPPPHKPFGKPPIVIG